MLIVIRRQWLERDAVQQTLHNWLICLLPAEGHWQGCAVVQPHHMTLLGAHSNLPKPDWLGQLILCGLSFTYGLYVYAQGSACEHQQHVSDTLCYCLL